MALALSLVPEPDVFEVEVLLEDCGTEGVSGGVVVLEEELDFAEEFVFGEAFVLEEVALAEEDDLEEEEGLVEDDGGLGFALAAESLAMELAVFSSEEAVFSASFLVSLEREFSAISLVDSESAMVLTERTE